MARYVVGVSGASGTILAYRLCLALGELGHEVELVMSKAALYTASEEMGREWATAQKFVQHLSGEVTLHSIHDVGASICSGSYPTDGMIIIPCSMATLAAVAAGICENALRRAADVTLKEGRPLVLVPRETPMSALHLENMLKLSRLGVHMVLPVPAWYIGEQSLEASELYIVGKVLDALKIEHSLYKRWKISGLEGAGREKHSAFH